MRAGRRRLWRWAVTVWAVAVVVGGGLTLWLQDSAEPPEPYGWEETEDPAPLLRSDVESLCPSATFRPEEDFVCAYATIR
ncbi:hypothetical protein AB0I98_11345 [Streptomyces sp. NPDC050211]|uniref:hypothetical protein n=1 Tax=Streptomyces sp. NPDC050211 TaxID=3154932 RepID=UPI003427995D